MYSTTRKIQPITSKSHRNWFSKKKSKFILINWVVHYCNIFSKDADVLALGPVITYDRGIRWQIIYKNDVSKSMLIDWVAHDYNSLSGESSVSANVEASAKNRGITWHKKMMFQSPC